MKNFKIEFNAIYATISTNDNSWRIRFGISTVQYAMLKSIHEEGNVDLMEHIVTTMYWASSEVVTDSGLFKTINSYYISKYHEGYKKGDNGTGQESMS